MSPRAFFVSVVALLLPSCIVTTESDDPPPVVVAESSGVVVIDWSIDGLKDPNVCDQSDADSLLVSIWTDAGVHVGDFEQYCQVFEASIELEPGTYAAEAVLLAPDGIERTTPIEIAPFDIFGNDMLEVPIDFPASSFY